MCCRGFPLADLLLLFSSGAAGCPAVLFPSRARSHHSQQLVRFEARASRLCVVFEYSRMCDNFLLASLHLAFHTSPKMKDMQAALMNAGFRVSQQHKVRGSSELC